MGLFKEFPFWVACKHYISFVLALMSFIIPNRYILIRYYGGRIYLNLKESYSMINRALGVYEYWKTLLIMDLIKPGMTIIDVGVNKGYYSLLFAKLMNDKGIVLSFEPVEENCYWIKKSININKYKCIKLYQYALSNKEEEVTFYLGKKSGHGSIFLSQSNVDSEKAPITIKTRKLDDVLKENNIDKIDFIKIDVEGAELMVLQGAENALKKSENLKLVVDLDRISKEDKKQLIDMLISFGFKIYRIGRELEPVKEINDKTEEIYATKTA